MNEVAFVLWKRDEYFCIEFVWHKMIYKYANTKGLKLIFFYKWVGLGSFK